MKVRDVAALAALGMMLTSYSVWSLTEPRGAKPEPTVDVGATNGDPIVDPRKPVLVDRSQFTAGGTLMMEGRLGHAKLQAGRDNETFLFVNTRADATLTSGTGSPLNLAIVIDRSGSMKGKRLDNALDGARGMVRRLRDGDAVSVIAYDTQSQVIVAPTTIDGGSRDRVASSITGIAARGDTCISCGLDTAVDLLGQRSGMVNRVLLLSDGEATAGVRDIEGFRNLAARVRRLGASISAIGVDVDYNERIMSALAVESNGRHAFVATSAGLSQMFDDELQSLVKTVAKDAEIVVDLAPGIEVDRVFDRTFTREGNKLRVPMGTFSAGEQKSLLVKVRVPRGAEGERAIADFRMSYDDLAKSSRGDCNGSLVALLATDPAQASPLDALVSSRLARADTAATLREANDLFASGRDDEARRRLGSKLAELKATRARAENEAPSPFKAGVKDDFDRQAAALGSASSGFSADAPVAASPGQPAPPAPRPAETRKGKEQVRRNAESATDFAF